MSSLTLLTNVLYLFVHWEKKKEKVCGTIKHGLTEKLTQQETKTAPTSSQLQTPADLKHRQRHYCMLFCIGLPLLAGVCLPSDSKVPRVWKDQSALLCHVKDFLLSIMLLSLEWRRCDGWRQRVESGTLNHWAVECQAAVGRLTFNVPFLEKKGKEDLTRPISPREATTTAMWGIRWWYGSTYPSAFAHTCWQQSYINFHYARGQSQPI